jgi:predicted nucleic acid-binding protein
MIFVDTGGWFARVVPTDKHHAAAVEWSQSNRERRLTTDYVVAETPTLLRMRGERERALVMGSEFFESGQVDLYYLTEDDIRQAWQTFRRYSDKGWSFTDCTSKVVIEKLGIERALAFDHHFHQFGSVTVVP